MTLSLEHDRALAPLTTLGLGGPAHHFTTVDRRELLREALRWAEARALPVGILGGGSNVIVSDAGFPGLVVRMALRGVELERTGERATLTAQAGEPWDDVVELALREELQGIECLTGIPGLAGATPIQNVGAYGQEVSDVLEAVEVLDRTSGGSTWLAARECAFGYRDSRFKREPERFVVLAVRLCLRPGAAPCVRYGELTRALGSGAPSLRAVADTVRALRAQKGMLIDASFTPSAGSFFMNPIVRAEEAERVVQIALSAGLVERAEQVPRFAAPDGQVKLAAAWLVEHAGIAKGLRRGSVGVSRQHALALVHHGGGTTGELIALATEIQQQVARVFGVALQIEPVRWGA